MPESRLRMPACFKIAAVSHDSDKHPCVPSPCHTPRARRSGLPQGLPKFTSAMGDAARYVPLILQNRSSEPVQPQTHGRLVECVYWVEAELDVPWGGDVRVDLPTTICECCAAMCVRWTTQRPLALLRVTDSVPASAEFRNSSHGSARRSNPGDRGPCRAARVGPNRHGARAARHQQPGVRVLMQQSDARTIVEVQPVLLGGTPAATRNHDGQGARRARTCAASSRLLHYNELERCAVVCA